MSAIIDRFNGLVGAIAIKVPCRVATTASITLSGLQTIDGIAVVADDRVLVKNDGVSNGIYKVSATAWIREPDWDGSFDIVRGTKIIVNEGTVNGGLTFKVTTADPITIGTTSVTIANDDAVRAATETVAGIAEIATQTETNTGTDDARIITPLKLTTMVATESQLGVSKIASQTETNTGTNDAKFITPLKLATRTSTETLAGIAAIATQAEITTGTNDTKFVTPLKLATRTSTETLAGIAAIATQAEITTGTNDTKMVTPLKLATRAATETLTGIAELATQTETNTGTDDVRIVTPLKALTFAKRFGMEQGLVGGYVAWSVAANALTLAIKATGGNDPSASEPVYCVFRNSSQTSGDETVVAITAALSLTVSSGSTLGTVSGVPCRIRAIAINTGAGVVLGVYNSLNDTNKSLKAVDATGILMSTTAEGGAGAADSAQVIYSAAAQTSKPGVEIGYMESSQVTAGTWAAAPTIVENVTFNSYKTGDVIQSVEQITSTNASGTTTTPADDTIPQVTEGDQYMSLAVSPVSASNLLEITTNSIVYHSVANVAEIGALFRDGAANAIASTYATSATASAGVMLPMKIRANAKATASTTFTVRVGGSSAGTTTFNGAFMGGTLNSYIHINEIFA